MPGIQRSDSHEFSIAEVVNATLKDSNKILPQKESCLIDLPYGSSGSISHKSAVEQ
jgi:hypothetical protein